MFAWDEAKRLANLKKHGINFADAEKIFRALPSPPRMTAKPMVNAAFSLWVSSRTKWCR